MKPDQFSCKTLWESLSDYIDGELSDELCQRVEQHMAGCEHCRVVVDTTHKTILLYHDMAEETEVPDDVRARLVETLHLEDFLKPKLSAEDFLMEPGNGKNQSLILLMIGVGLMLLAVAAFLAIPKAQENLETAEMVVAPLAINFPAPDIQLTDLADRPVAFSDYTGQVILYNAWATWCPPCKEEMPTLEAYYTAHKHSGFVVIAIEDGQPVSEVAAYAKNLGLTFPVWPDLKWIATAKFGINHLPTSYVIDRRGAARLTWSGVITREALEEYVTPLLKEE